MIKDAVISECKKYRYLLTRSWGEQRKCTFIMLNPSTADAEIDDPTIRRCIGFAKKFGCEKLSVVNLFPFRATDPKELRIVTNKINGEDDFKNYGFIIKECKSSDIVICAWGSNKSASFNGYDKEFVQRLKEEKVELFCLKKSLKECPCHPLYLPKNSELIPFNKG